MRIEVLPALVDNYAYLAWDGDVAAAIDPPEAGVVLSALQKTGARLAAVLVTHHHADHTGGCLALKQATGCVIAGPADARVPTIERPLRDGEVFRAGPVEVQAIAVPGHTRSHLAFFSRAWNAVWTGDTLFCAGCGRLLEGTPEQMWASLQLLRSLPEPTRVYCGHDYTVDNLEFAAELEPANREVADRLKGTRMLSAGGAASVPSTIGLEKLTNPFLRCDAPALQRAIGMSGAAPAAVFAEVRRRKDNW